MIFPTYASTSRLDKMDPGGMFANAFGMFMRVADADRCAFRARPDGFAFSLRGAHSGFWLFHQPSRRSRMVSLTSSIDMDGWAHCAAAIAARRTCVRRPDTSRGKNRNR
jgi:hypothetical protein